MDKRPTEQVPTGKGASLHLSPPWNSVAERFARGNVAIQEGSFLSPEDLKNFVETRTGLHNLYIRETQRTRRLAMCLAAALLALASVIPVFAPAGRENMSYWIGAALFVFAAGSMGYTSIQMASDKRQIALSKETSDA